MKKAIFLLSTFLTIFFTANLIYAENIEKTTEATTDEQQLVQLTDYRYRSVARLLENYTYMSTERHRYGLESLSGEDYTESLRYSYNSIIKPDGTLLDYGNYMAVCGIVETEGSGNYNYYFPQNEAGNRFILEKENEIEVNTPPYRSFLLDENGNVLISNEENRNDLNFLTSDYVFSSNKLYKSIDGTCIFDYNDYKPEDYKQERIEYSRLIYVPPMINFYVSEDRTQFLAIQNYIATDNTTHVRYVFLDGNGKVSDEGNLLEIPFKEQYLHKGLSEFKNNELYCGIYQDKNGVLYEKIRYGDIYEGGPRCEIDYDNMPTGHRNYYSFLQPDWGTFKSDRLKDKNRITKSITINGRSYYALFRTLQEGETAEDYKPTEKPSDWARESIEKATNEGLLYNNSNCFYTSPITRADFCILAMEIYCKALGMSVDEYVAANDLDLSQYSFYDCENHIVRLANYLGIVQGKIDEHRCNCFYPDDKITRQEAAVILNNIANLAGLKPNSAKVNYIDSQYYADWAKASIYNISSIKNNQGVAIMSGTEPNKFSPWMYYTREQAYVTLYRMYEMMK